MNKRAKEFKIYSGIIFVTLLLTFMGTAYIYWLNRTTIPDIAAIRQETEKEGREFGANKIMDDCVNESLNRIKLCNVSDYTCRVKNKLFLQQCLVYSKIEKKKTPGICDEILDQVNNKDAKIPGWTTQTCANHKDIHNIVCANTLEAVESYCRAKSGKP